MPDPAASSPDPLHHPAWRTSARNRFAGPVVALREGAVNDEVELRLIGGLLLVATITRESREAMGLAVGAPAFALVPSSAVMLMVAGAGTRLSARNQYAGTVERIVPGAVNSEVVLSLPGGGHVAAMETTAGLESLGLARGAPAVALFKTSSVIVGVAG